MSLTGNKNCNSIIYSYLDIEMYFAYEIGRFIQSFVTNKIGDKSGKPWSDYDSHFNDGPLGGEYQTKRGLVLQEYYGMPSGIHTPWGKWNVLGSGSGDFGKVLEKLKEPLGLIKIKEKEYIKNVGEKGPFWAITKWGSIILPMPVYKEGSEYILYDGKKLLIEDLFKSVGLKCWWKS